jgi:hypothetical protein
MKRQASVGKFYLYTILVITALYILCSCGIVPQEQTITVKWEDSIQNPDNEEFVVEVAFNEDVEPQDVTQAMFNERYTQ